MQRLFFVGALALLSTAQATSSCPTRSAAQLRLDAQHAAISAARATLMTAQYGYASQYRNISYLVTPRTTSVKGNTATVTGKITVTGTNRATGQHEKNVLNGTAKLMRSNCIWRVTGYQPS